MPIFTAIGAAIFGAGTFFAGATAFVLRVAAGIGLSLLARSLAGSKEVSAPQFQQPGFSVQGRIQSGGVVPRSFPMGYTATAGSLVYANTWGAEGGTPNAYLTQVIALSDLPGAGLAGLWVNGEFVTLLNDEPHESYGVPVEQYRVGGKDHLWIKFYDGTQTTADSFLVNSVSSVERPYESSRVGTGVCYAICTALVNDALFTGFPTYKFELSGVPLYDVSKDSTAGGEGDHRWSDPATWGGDGDDLPAVQLYNLLRGVTYGGSWFYGLQGMVAARLPADDWIVEIEKCRTVVAGPDGDEPTYRSGGQFAVGNEIGSAVEQLLTAMHGRLAEIGGVYKLHAGTPGSAVYSFTDDDILSTEEQSFTPFFGLHDSINGVAASYPSPEEGWETKAAPPLLRPDLEVLDGNRRLMADVKLDLVPYDRQVQHLMQSALEEARRARRHTFTLPPGAWVLEPGDIVEWTSARNGYATKLFRADGTIDKANLDVIVDLTEIDPADYGWDQDADFTAPVVGPTLLVRPPPQAIIDWTVAPTALYDDLGLERRPAILLSWDGDREDIEGIEFEIRLKSSADVVHRGRTENFAAGSVVVSQGILPLTEYEARGRYIPASPRIALWSDWLSVTMVDALLSQRDFSAALKKFFFEQQTEAQQQLNKISQLIASVAAESDAAGELNKGNLRRELMVRAGQITASYLEAISVAVGPGSAVAESLTTLQAAIENVEASLAARFVVGVTPDGAIAAYELQATAEEANAGFRIVAYDDGFGGALGQIWFDADRFYVGKTGDAEFVPVFVVDNTVEPPRIAINGDLLVAGSVTAAKLNVSELTAITAAFGTATVSGQLTSANGKMVIDFNANQVVFSD